ncbi:MAG: DUF362 domain-containing protein [Clostridium sp.]
MSRVAIESCEGYEPLQLEKALTHMMESLGYDFSDFIKPGMTVFIKPNWVASRWRESAPHRDTLYSVITHPAVIEAVADRAARALKGKGRIMIGDNPSIDADFGELLETTGIGKLAEKYDIPCEILDLRPLVCKDLKDYGKKDKMVGQTGDPRGEVTINLGKDSLFYGVDPTLFRGVFDEREDTIASHHKDTQLYTFSKSIYESDVYISVPKLKTHQKVGATLNLKGLVGCVTQKNQLVHWKIGTPDTGGDEYPDKESFEAARTAKVTHRGAHPGNDTIWRMVVDLYQAFGSKKRSCFSVVDGIIGGEGQGPFCPHARQSNVLIGGKSLLDVDMAAVRLMGLNPRKIRYLNWFIEHGYALENIKVPGYEHFFESESRYLDYQVEPQWQEIKV